MVHSRKLRKACDFCGRLMGYRRSKRIEEKRIWITRIILTIISIVLTIAACLVWMIKYNSPQYIKFITIAQTIFVVDIFLYLATVSSRVKVYTSIIRAFLKLLFTVWVVSFVLFTITNQYSQNIILIYSTFIIGYLEVFFDLNDVFESEIEKLSNKVVKYNKSFEISKLSRQLTISFVSILHILIAFFLQSSISSFQNLVNGL